MNLNDGQRALIRSLSKRGHVPDAVAETDQFKVLTRMGLFETQYGTGRVPHPVTFSTVGRVVANLLDEIGVDGSDK